MTGITKKQAHIIAAHGYKIVDKDDTVFGIHSVDDVKMYLYGSRAGLDKYVSLADFGTDYFILCLPYEALTKEVDGVGIPVVELGFPNTKEVYDSFIYVMGLNHVPASEADKLMDWHFPPHGIPTECLKFIEI